MSKRLAHSARQAIGAFDSQKLMQPLRVGSLRACRGQFLEASGFPYAVGTAVRIPCPHGPGAIGEVVGFRGPISLIQPLSSTASIAAGLPVYPAGQHSDVACGDALLGRVIGAQGEPLDGKSLPSCTVRWPIAGKPSNPLARGRIVRPADCGVRAINGLLSIGEGQRVAIVAGSGVGKSVLTGQILDGFDADIVVTGLIGERAREVSDFVEKRMMSDTAARSIVVAVAADRSPLLRLRAAMRATAIAEYFRSQGKRVLLMIDSLTRIAHAQREIGLALGEPPTMKGYTPSALALIPQLVERAGVDTRSGGAITAIYTVLADGGDLDDPIVDAARAIVDGHIILSRTLAEAGVFPAIDVARSLSRIMPDIVDAEHLAAAGRFRRLWSAYEDNRDLLLMGAYAPGSDALLDEAIAARSAMLDFVKQSVNGHVGWAETREALIDGFGDQA
jgi:flagellum-specific ATP synthase